MPTSSTSPRSTPPGRPRSRRACPPSTTSAWPSAGALLLSLVATTSLAASGCKRAADPPDPATSPQARAEPAPLANLSATTGTGAAPSTLDAGPLPEALRSDVALPADLPHETTRELVLRDASRDASRETREVREARELAGYALQAVVRSGEGPPGPRAPEVNGAAIEAARRKNEAHLAIELSQTRARFVLTGAFVLPQGTELRARVDRYGHVVLWPGEETYRILEPGALRAFLGERRLDVAPLSPAALTPAGEGARRLGYRTRRVEVSTRAAKASIELAAVRDGGEGGGLVCRMLLDLMSAPPSVAPCGLDEIPLHAEIRWMTRGALTFDATSMARRMDMPLQELAAPPASATFEPGPPPLQPADALLPRGELASFRTAPVDVPASSARDARAPSPEAGLVLVNTTDEMRIVWLDGVPVAWVAPGAQEGLPTLVRGRYVVQWRTFLGDSWSPPETATVPGVSEAAD
jgi:hypothetical protein